MERQREKGVEKERGLRRRERGREETEGSGRERKGVGVRTDGER